MKKIIVLLITLLMVGGASAFFDTPTSTTILKQGSSGSVSTSLPAENITQGTFGAGDYVFPGWVDITTHLDMTGGSIWNLNDIYTTGNLNLVSNLTTPYNISAQYYYGDGSYLTGISGGSSGNPFDQWLNTTDTPTFNDLIITDDINLHDDLQLEQFSIMTWSFGNFNSAIGSTNYYEPYMLANYYDEGFFQTESLLLQLKPQNSQIWFETTNPSAPITLCMDSTCATMAQMIDTGDNTNAGTICSGNNNYLSGENTCDQIETAKAFCGQPTDVITNAGNCIDMSGVNGFDQEVLTTSTVTFDSLTVTTGGIDTTYIVNDTLVTGNINVTKEIYMLDNSNIRFDDDGTIVWNYGATNANISTLGMQSGDGFKMWSQFIDSQDSNLISLELNSAENKLKLRKIAGTGDAIQYCDNNNCGTVGEFLAQDNPFDQWVNTTDNVTFNSLSVDGHSFTNVSGDLIINNSGLNKNVIFSINSDGNNIDFLTINSSIPQVSIGSDNVAIDPGTIGLLNIGGLIDSGFISALLGFNPIVTGSSVIAFLVSPTINSDGIFQLFRFTPSYGANDHKGEMLFFAPTTPHAVGYDDDYKVYTGSFTRQFLGAGMNDPSTVNYDWFTMGGAFALGDFGGSTALPDINENMIKLKGGASRIAGTLGSINQQGLIFEGFGTQVGLITGTDSVTALTSDGGDFNFLGGSNVNISNLYSNNLTAPYPSLTIPIGGFWVDDDITGGLSATLTGADTLHNITNLNASSVMVGEGEYFSVSQGIGTINFTDSGKGVYRVYMGASFESNKIGVFHCAVYKNWNDKQEISLQRKVSSINSVGDAGKVGFIRVVQGDFINIQCETDVSTSPMITVNHLNFNIERVSK